jgi:Tfp pilus assembly protein PilV
MEVPMIRRNRRAGFALIDPLIGLLAVASVMVGVINFWRLAEYKSDKARIDARVTQILRESSDYMAYVPYDLLPADGAQFRSGFLLHPLDPTTGAYKEIYPFSVTVAVTTTNADTAAEAKEIVLTLTYNTSPEPVSTNSVQETIRTNALTRVKT